MTLQQLLESLAVNRQERLLVALQGAAADVVIADIVGSGHHVERSLRGIADGDGLLTVGYLAIADHLDAALCRQPAWHALLLDIVHRGRELMATDGNCRLQLAVERGGELQGPFLAGLNAHNDGIVGLRGKDDAFVAHTFIDIRGGGGGIA